MTGWPDVLRVGWCRPFRGVCSPGLPKFLEVGGRVVLGVFNAEGRITALVADFRAKITSFGGVVQIKEGIALGVGFVDQRARNSMVGQRKESNVLEGITNLADEPLSLILGFR